MKQAPHAAPAKAGQEHATLPPRQPNEAPGAAQRLASWVRSWFRRPHQFPQDAALATLELVSAGPAEKFLDRHGLTQHARSTEQEEKRAQSTEPRARKEVTPQVYGDGTARLECAGVPVPVLLEINGPKDVAMHLVAPLGVHVVESALLRIDDAGALRIVLNLAVLDESDVVVSRHLNG